MSYINEIEFDLTVGAQYELGPIEMSYLLGRVLTAGGKAVIEGDVLIITEMPGQPSEPEPVPVEAVTIAPEVKPEPPVVQEAPVEVEPAPIKRAPKPKAEEPKEDPKPEQAKTEDPIPAPVEE